MNKVFLSVSLSQNQKQGLLKETSDVLLLAVSSLWQQGESRRPWQSFEWKHPRSRTWQEVGWLTLRRGSLATRRGQELIADEPLPFLMTAEQIRAGPGGVRRRLKLRRWWWYADDVRLNNKGHRILLRNSIIRLLTQLDIIVLVHVATPLIYFNVIYHQLCLELALK